MLLLPTLPLSKEIICTKNRNHIKHNTIVIGIVGWVEGCETQHKYPGLLSFVSSTQPTIALLRSILIKINDQEKIVTILSIGHRRDVYRP